MSSDPHYPVYDFATSALIERPLWIAFNNWMQKSNELLVEAWSNLSKTEISANQAPINAQEFEALRVSWNLPRLAVELAVKGQPPIGLLGINRQGLLGIVMDILGDTSEIEDRELTSIEASLARLVFETAVGSIASGWPDQSPIELEMSDVIFQPNRSRLFSAEKLLLTSGVCLQFNETQAEFDLTLAKDETCDLLGIKPRSDVAPTNGRTIPEEQIAKVSVIVTAQLGTASLSMDDFVSISCGDIVVLEQFVSQPAIVSVNDEPVFRAWPGRVESKQAMKIVSEISE